MPISVSLLDKFSHRATILARHAGNTCYQKKVSPIGKNKLDLEARIWNTGHHTVPTHPHYMFEIAGASVSAFTFGLHLMKQFSNTSQKSGRFSSEMFGDPAAVDLTLANVRTLYPDLTETQYAAVENFVHEQFALYRTDLPRAIDCMKQRIREERPRTNASYIETNGKKFAQEQFRMIVPTATPTAADFTCSLMHIVQMYHVTHVEGSWGPELREITAQMRDIVLSEDPELSYMFDVGSPTNLEDWHPAFPETCREVYSPEVELLGVYGDVSDFVLPDPAHMFPVDLLQYLPRYMNNNAIKVATRHRGSLAWMGQKQRARTIDRTEPVFTGGFYSPFAIIQVLASGAIERMMHNWLQLRDILPGSLVTMLAPYGAVVQFDAVANMNALAHEQMKRECWCAQEEIYNDSRLLREAIIARHGADCPLLAVFAPPCYRNGGKCVEGDRYCGRVIITDEMPNAAEAFAPRTI